MFRARMFCVWVGLGCLGHGNLSGEELFFTAQICGSCHSAGSGALVDEAGNDVSIWHDWAGSMMGNALRDPLFQAKIASEIERSPELKSVIEDKCTRCHAPMGRTQWYHDGHRDFGLIQTQDSALAYDGVSCALCHQIQKTDLGKRKSFGGHYVIEAKREIYGPYPEVFTNPMRHHLDYTPMFGEQIGQSRLCGSCHVLFTPIVDAAGEVHGEFPEQTVYLEWENSVYANETFRRDCQDCHLRRVDGAVKITRRPPWYQVKREPFKQHTFDGGNRLMLGMLRGMAQEMKKDVVARELTEAMQRSEAMLGGSAAIEILKADVDETLDLEVAVNNNAGHKLPTGYPSRRVWVRLEVKNADGTTLFRSGGWDAEGEIIGLDEPYEPHHEVIDGEEDVQIYQSVMGDREGTVTHTLLRAATYLKDNRLPPVGFKADGPWIEHTAVAGKATEDDDFNRQGETEGTGRDIIRYRVPLQGAVWPLRVEAELLYQTVSGGFVKDLLRSETERGREFRSLYAKADKEPVRMARTSIRVENPNGRLALAAQR